MSTYDHRAYYEKNRDRILARLKAKYERERAVSAITLTCAWPACGKSFQSLSIVNGRRVHRKKYCQDTCVRRAEKRKQRDKGHDGWGPKRTQRIAERDGWRCGLCGEDIDRELRYPHPRSVSLDHILPASRGGSGRRDNLRAAHLWCNLERSDNVAVFIDLDGSIDVTDIGDCDLSRRGLAFVKRAADGRS